MTSPSLRVRIATAVAALALTAGYGAPAYAAPTPTPTPTPKSTATPTRSATKAAHPGVRQISVPQARPSVVDGRTVVAALAPQATSRFSMAGVTWAASSTAPTVQVRTQALDGTWSSWSTLPKESLVAEGSKRQGTAPAYTGDAQGIEVRVLVDAGATAPGDLQLSLIDPGRLATDAAPEETRPAANGRAVTQAAQPSVVSRAAWGADESLKSQSGASCMTPKYDRTIKAVVVHHTEGSNDYTADRSASIVRGIYAYHVTGNGWCDIGYNFLIDRYGKIFEGRAGGITRPVHGAHAFDWNTDTMGISVMGSFSAQLPPAAALDSAVRLTAWRLAAYYREPFGRLTIGRYTSDVISGHRQVSDTDCPGDAFFNYLPTFRDRVAQTMGSYRTPIWNRWQQLGGAGSFTGDLYEGEQPYLGGRITRFWGATLYQRPDGGVAWARGAILSKYESMGEARSTLGFPLTDENCEAAGCWQKFERGFILWSPPTGAHTVWGAIQEKHAQMGNERGVLGYPVTDEVCADGGCQQQFQGGWLLWSPATGAHNSWGMLRDRYLQLGGHKGWLGYPSSDEMCDARGCWQDYQGGSLALNGQRGLHWVRSAIRDRYLAKGGRNGMFGYPSSDEICGLRDGGCFQAFGPDGFYWSPTTGAWENLGAIREAYASQGYENGRLGWPTSGEQCDANGCVQRFQGGQITWNPRTGARIS